MNLDDDKSENIVDESNLEYIKDEYNVESNSECNKTNPEYDENEYNVDETNPEYNQDEYNQDESNTEYYADENDTGYYADERNIENYMNGIETETNSAQDSGSNKSPFVYEIDEEAEMVEDYTESNMTLEEHLENEFVPKDDKEHYLLLVGHTPTQILLKRKLEEVRRRTFKVPEALVEPESAVPSDLEVAAQAAVEEAETAQDAQTTVLSDIYNTLDENVDRMAQERHSLEVQRAYTYPQFYKYHSQLNIGFDENEKRSIMAFKQMLLKTGQISECDPEALIMPKRIDLSKNYFITGYNNDTYYKRKILPNLSSDELVQSLLKQTKCDIVISISCLLKLAEIQSNPSVNGSIPLIVKQEGEKKILYFDSPLPKDTLTAEEKNKIVYNVAFKSSCLDWSNRRPISSSSKQKKQTADNWNYDDDENLQYTHWTFGDLDLLIRYQSDGDVASLENKRASLVSKLDYGTSKADGEMTIYAERVMNWLRSYIGGHSIVIEGTIDVVNNSLVHIEKKEMVDIMEDWMPDRESEMLRQALANLYKTLEPGCYLLGHETNEKHFVVYQSTEETLSSDVLDLHGKYIPV
ncbi:unnamed protein product [Rhizopus stolonifer]